MASHRMPTEEKLIHQLFSQCGIHWHIQFFAMKCSRQTAPFCCLLPQCKGVKRTKCQYLVVGTLWYDLALYAMPYLNPHNYCKCSGNMNNWAASQGHSMGWKQSKRSYYTVFLWLWQSSYLDDQFSHSAHVQLSDIWTGIAMATICVPRKWPKFFFFAVCSCKWSKTL